MANTLPRRALPRGRLAPPTDKSFAGHTTSPRMMGRRGDTVIFSLFSPRPPRVHRAFRSTTGWLYRVVASGRRVRNHTSMLDRALIRVVVVTILVGCTSAVGVGGQEASWEPTRTVDGHPDLQGVWLNNVATPVERPPALAGRAHPRGLVSGPDQAVVHARGRRRFDLQPDLHRPDDLGRDMGGGDVSPAARPAHL